jgi:hypothetical protein
MRKRLQVDRKKFARIVQNMLQAKPLEALRGQGREAQAGEVNPAAEMKFCSAIRTCTVERYT